MAKKVDGRRLPLVMLVIGVFTIYSIYVMTRYSQFLSAGYDLGIFDQAIRRYANFSSPMVPLKGDHYHLLGDHFHPILALLAPLYWLWDDPRVLLIAQSGLVALSVPLVHAFARRKLGAKPAWLFSFGYVFAWPIQGMIDFDFHEIAFAIPLLAWILNCLDLKHDGQLLVCCLLLLGVREDMGVIVAMIGLVRLFIPSRRWLGGVLIAVGLVCFAVVTMAVIPHFNVSGEFNYWDYPALGTDAKSAFMFMLRHPFRTMKLLFVPAVKAQTWMLLFFPLLMLPVFSRYTVIALPLLAQRFFSSRANLWLTEFHYSAPIWVILCCAAVDVLGRFAEKRRRPLGAMLAVAVALVAVCGTATETTLFPLRRLGFEAWRSTPQMQSQNRTVEQIPAGVCVAVDDRLVTHLTKRNRVSLPGIAQPMPDYVALDLSQEKVGYKLLSPGYYFNAYLASGYNVEYQDGSLVMLRRSGEIIVRQECQPKAP